VRLLAASREPVLCEDAQTDPRFAAAADLQDREVRSMLGLPLLHKSQLVGALVLENNLATGVFTAERLELLRMLSAQIAVALENAALVEDLRDLNVAYARFVPQQFLRFLGKEQITELSLGDAIERDMTVMFCDIRGFTARSEGQLPEENFRFINRYLSHIGPTIRKHGGFIDKYIGDGVMALFPGSSEAAVRAATAMGRALRDFNRELEADGEPAVDIGIGLHRGRLMLGTIGEAERMESTVISDAVNTAARVESLTRRFGCSCLLTEAVVDALPGRDSFLTRYLGRVLVKGRRDAVAVFELFQGDRRELREQKWSRRADFEGAVRAREDGASEAARTALEALVQAVPEDAVAARLLAELAP